MQKISFEFNGDGAGKTVLELNDFPKITQSDWLDKVGSDFKNKLEDIISKTNISEIEALSSIEKDLDKLRELSIPYDWR